MALKLTELGEPWSGLGKGALGGNKDVLGHGGQTQAWLRAASSELGWKSRYPGRSERGGRQRLESHLSVEDTLSPRL